MTSETSTQKISSSPYRNVATDLASGAVAAVTARCVIAPVERVKIIYQISNSGGSSSSTSSNNIMHVVRRIYSEGGITAYWRGLSAAVGRIAPYMGLKFVVLEKYKTYLFNGNAFLAGSLAGVTATAATYPLDLLRARMAVSHEAHPTYRSITREIVAKQGWLGLTAGMSVTLKGIAIHDAFKFGSYDMTKQFVARNVFGYESEKQLPFSARVAIGAVAGAVAQTVCYPSDVIRRRMQTVPDGQAPPYRGLTHGVLEIYRREGVVRGLYRGYSLNLLKASPNIAIYMSLYDYCSEALPRVIERTIG
eukprot:PhM_4_TR2670/c0_g1_i1/m.52167/K15085/SLC25A42; solute carrier family 25, member 42